MKELTHLLTFLRHQGRNGSTAAAQGKVARKVCQMQYNIRDGLENTYPCDDRAHCPVAQLVLEGQQVHSAFRQHA